MRALALATVVLVGCSTSPAPIADSGLDSTTPGADGGLPDGPVPDAGVASDASLAADAWSASDAGAPCDGVSCSGLGRCVEVDGEATCACDRGLYAVGLECVGDPCASGDGACRYVDPVDGEDTGPGTRDAPWRSLAHAMAEAPSLGPGSYVLLRRGRDFGAAPLRLRALVGLEGGWITVGAYGPDTDGRPVVTIAAIDGGCAFVTLRDIEIRPAMETCTPSVDCHACMTVNDSHDVVIENVHVHHCFSNGIVLGAGSHHTTVIDSHIHDIAANDGITIHDGDADEADVGDHHWIADNVIGAVMGEQGIDVAVGGGGHAAAHDVKIVGNAIGGMRAGCVMTAYQAEHVWIVANLLGDCVLGKTNAAVHLGANDAGSVDMRRNVVFRSGFYSLVNVRAGVPVRIVANTFLPAPLVRNGTWRFGTAAEIAFARNVVGSQEGNSGHLLIEREGVPAATSSDNWYLPTSAGCRIYGATLEDHQASTGREVGSRCADVPGLAGPSSEVDPSRFGEPSFLAGFRPDSSWAGCATGVGAVACDGSLSAEWAAFEDYPDGGGLGWRGPLVIRQRYPLP